MKKIKDINEICAKLKKEGQQPLNFEVEEK